MMNSKRWHLIYTKVNMEKKTADQLRELNVDTLLPLKTEVRKWHDRRKVLKSPAYPCYLFVEVGDRKDYIKVMEVKNVLSFVRMGNQIVNISDHTIRNMRILIENNCDIFLTSDRIKQSDQVVIKSGPLTGLSGEIVDIDKSRKFVIRVNFLYRDLMITLPVEAITKK